MKTLRLLGYVQVEPSVVMFSDVHCVVVVVVFDETRRRVLGLGYNMEIVSSVK